MAFVPFDLFEEAGAGASTGGARSDRYAVVKRGVAGLEQIEPVWRGLESAGAQPFLSYGFAHAAARYHEARGEKTLFSVAYWGGRPVCVLPIAVTRRHGIYVGVFLGDPIAQYGDALLAAGAPGMAAEVALRQLIASANLDVFEFRRVRSDAAIRPALRLIARSSGEIVQAPYADLGVGGSVEDLLLRIGGAKQRRERARSRRRLAERGEVTFEVLRGPAAVADLQEAFRLKRGWLAESGEVSQVIDDPAALEVFERLACDRRDGSALVVGRLMVGDAPAAYEVGVLGAGRFHAYLGAVASEFASASPGKILMEDMFGWCRDNGVAAYDLLPPADPYKAQWATGSIEVANHVVPRTLVGRLYAGPWLNELRPRMRAALRSLPPALRRRVGRAALQAGAC